WIAFMTLHPLDEPETGTLAFSLVAGRQRFSWILPEGGSIRLPLALARIIEENGGTIMTSRPVTRIVVEGGRATGVVTADGSTYGATKAVVSSIHIRHLPDIVGDTNLGPDYAAGIARWKPSVTMFAAHYALSEPPRFKTKPARWRASPWAVSNRSRRWRGCSRPFAPAASIWTIRSSWR